MAIKMSDLRDELRETRERAELAEHQSENMARMMTAIEVRMEHVRFENALLRELALKATTMDVYNEIVYSDAYDLREMAIALLERLGGINKTKEATDEAR